MNVVTINLSTGFIEVTKADLDNLISTNGLVESKFYHITDRDIYLQALETNVISTTGERVMRIVKNLYYTPDTGILGVWNANITPTIGDVAVWGGKVWENITGNVGTFTDDTALDPTDWILIPTTDDTYYFTKSFGCTYDIVNDWVASQWDDRGNVFTLSWILNQNEYGFSYNIIDISDWGNDNILQNACFGVSNNSNTGSVYNNSNNGLIYNNSNTGDIKYNSNREIIFNSNNGGIENNSNTGNVYNNSNNGGIGNNSNTGSIFNNSNSGFITNNSNAGRINSITSDTTNIEYNTNNGDITTTVVGVISDPIVSK